MTADLSDANDATNPYAPPNAVPDSALPRTSVEYNLTRMQLVQAAAICSVIATATVLIFSIFGPNSQPISLVFEVGLSLSAGIPAVAVLLLAGYRKSNRPQEKRFAICTFFSLISLSSLGLFDFAMRKLPSSLDGSSEILIVLLFLSATLSVTQLGILLIHGVSINAGRVLVALLVSVVAGVGVVAAVIFATETLQIPNPIEGYIVNVILVVSWICMAIVQIPIATKVQS